MMLHLHNETLNFEIFNQLSNVRESRWKVAYFSSQKKRKTRPTDGKICYGYYIKKTFSRRSREPPNPYLTQTQRHHSLGENNMCQALDICFDVGQTRDIFNTILNPRPKECYSSQPTNLARGPFAHILFQ